MGGLSPSKLGLIIVLTVILLVVLVVQFGDGDARSVASTRQGAQSRNQQEQPSPNALPVQASEAEGKDVTRSWPVFSVRDVLSHNPFALPVPLRPDDNPAREAGETEPVEAVIRAEGDARQQAISKLRRRQREFMASLRERGVDMILVTPQGRVARVGDLNLRVGDRIAGLKVKQINSQGIVFATEPIPAEQD